MAKLVILLMPWGRVGSNMVNGIVQRSKAMKVWNEPLTGVQTRVIGAGGTLADVWPAQEEWLMENILTAETDIFLNVAANSVADAAAFRETVRPLAPVHLVLDRRDDLATALSSLRTEEWVREGIAIGEQRNWSIPSGQSVNFRPNIDASKLKAAIAIIRQGRDNIATITEGYDTARYSYEELVSDMAGVVGDMLQRSGIPPYPFKAGTEKFGAGSLSKMVSNPQEIMDTANELGVESELTV